ncbi:MAG: cytosine permease [Solirubrobacteraceae bacterium]
MATTKEHDHLGGIELEAEFEREPVPPAHRKSLRTVAAVWFGFPMILTCAVFGGVLSALMGFQRAVLAIVVGNLVLFCYVGALSYFAGRTGRNFALQAKHVFGDLGYLLAAGFLSTIVIGWFAFNSGLTGATMKETFGWTEWLVTLLACIGFVLITFIGVRALAVLGLIAAPLFLVVAIIALIIASKTVTLSSLWNYKGVTSNPGAFSLGAGITLVVATFADSGTMTADFTRWAKDGRQAVLASATAFPLGNFLAFIAGAIVVAMGAISNPATAGGNFVVLLAKGHGSVLTVLAVLFVFISLGSVSSHCLYNGAVGWSNLLHTRMRVMCIILGVIGTIAATAGVWSHFLSWLNILGVFVPPIGGVIIAHQILAAVKPERALETLAVRPIAFMAYACGAAVAGVLHYLAPQGAEALAGMVIGAAAFVGLTLAMRRSPVASVPGVQIK